jgi:hypothetical protein
MACVTAAIRDIKQKSKSTLPFSTARISKMWQTLLNFKSILSEKGRGNE